MALARAAHDAGVKHGVIQDDAGSWIFDGALQPCQRPSWNYRRAEGGGIAFDTMAHWRYMVDRLAAPVTGVCALMATAIPERVDEHGKAYTVDAEDTSHALLQLAGGAVGVLTNSWATRIRRDDTMVVQIDGTLGSAVAGRFRCFTQAAANTPEMFFGSTRPGSIWRRQFRNFSIFSSRHIQPKSYVAIGSVIDPLECQPELRYRRPKMLGHDCVKVLPPLVARRPFNQAAQIMPR
jgi:predicted dehydrogenase